MSLEMTCRIIGTEIHISLTVDRPMRHPVFCFSLMAPGRVLSGGELVRCVGSYMEVALPDLSAGQAYTIVVAYDDPEFQVANRAWLPLGAYLRHANGIAELPSGKAGAEPWQPTSAGAGGELKLVPVPTYWRPSGGTLECVAVIANDPAFLRADQLAKRLGLRLLALDGLPVDIAHGAHGAEGYRLVIATTGIEVFAKTDAGFFHAAVTLINLIETHDGQLPCGEIIDEPRFIWRGQSLDCARHFYLPETLLEFVDRLALLKLNRFHWHFSDDEAFRIEVNCLPELWQQTRLRGEGLPIPGVFGGGVVSGGSYSKSFVRDLVARGQSVGVEILPEIEVPGHALALNAAVPGLRDPDDTGREVSVQGYFENTINPAVPKTWEVLDALVQEMSELFPFAHVHLGCDELPEGTWSGSPLVSRLKTREGLETTDDVCGWMMERLAAKVGSHGARPCAWEEAARGKNGGIGNDALLFSWSGQGPGIEAAKAGYDVVMSPAQHVYLDMAQSGAPEDWGAAWAAIVPLVETVNWEPVPDSLGDDADRILGVEGTFWSEFTTRDSEMFPMVWPRILGVACKAWCTQNEDLVNRITLLADDYMTTRLVPREAAHMAPAVGIEPTTN